jgi:hypothetical protein
MPSRVSMWLNDLLSDRGRVTKKERKGRKGFEGKQTGLPSNRWIAAVFELNEIRCIQSVMDQGTLPLTNAQIMYNYKQEFVNNRPKRFHKKPGGALSSGKHSIGMRRKQYRLGTLYAEQTKNIFMSFRYSPSGHICFDRSENRFPTFRQCQQMCIDFKIADPRFFSTDDMEKIHKYSIKTGTYTLWTIPTREEMMELFEQIPIELYRSVRTYDIWKKDAVPKDWSPPNDIEDEKEQQALEEQRRATKETIQEHSEEEFNPNEHF